MKVKELQEILAECDDDLEVVLQGDPEGNSHKRCDCAWNGAWDADEEEVGISVLTPEDAEEGYSEEDVLTNGVPAVILVPA